MKRKFLTILIFTLTFTSSYTNNLNYGVYYSLNRNFRSYDNDYSYLNKYDEKANSFNLGISIEKKLITRISISSGIDYSIDGFNRKPIYLIDGVYLYSTKYRLSYVGIPLEVNYYFLNRGIFKIGLNLGLNFKLLTYAKHIPYDIYELPAYMSTGRWSIPRIQKEPGTIKYSFSELNEKDFNIFNINTITGLRLIINLKNFSLGISPEYKFALLPTVKETGYIHPPKEKLYSYGLKICVSPLKHRNEL